MTIAHSGHWTYRRSERSHFGINGICYDFSQTKLLSCSVDTGRGHQRDIHDQHHGRAVQHRYRAHHSGVIGWAAGGSVLITRPCAEEWIQDHEKFWICVDRDIYCVQRDQRVA
ncbi:hypothetical protein BC936DRAFT_137334 [Jimgerdemannia flammicorona]|uniref:Uncharacterized protein n=1 Tax=Jimgerdemannia flammicorona TaxID=994334 RepID=A0A433CXL9_9FUNG|nr:hypothetical protein BC936DRAFT_137334 [Jimgerdemannia flammicorona]